MAWFAFFYYWGFNVNAVTQACISTLALRNMVTPFRMQNILENACPMDDILGHIAAQLAEFKALKEKSGKHHVNPHK